MRTAEDTCFFFLSFFFLPIEQLSCPKLPFTRLVYVNVHPENSRISFFFFFFSFFFYVGHTSSRGFQWRKVQSAICLRQVRTGLGLFYLNSFKSSGWLCTKSGQHQFSPNNFNTLSRERVLRIYKRTTERQSVFWPCAFPFVLFSPLN